MTIENTVIGEVPRPHMPVCVLLELVAGDDRLHCLRDVNEADQLRMPPQAAEVSACYAGEREEGAGGCLNDVNKNSKPKYISSLMATRHAGEGDEGASWCLHNVVTSSNSEYLYRD